MLIKSPLVDERWIDLLPHPRMRDNAIRAHGAFDPDELERDLTGRVCNDGSAAFEESCDFGVETRGILVWADPWRPEGMELTPGFVRKWWFLVKGCDEMFRATDRWRQSRGEGPLIAELLKDGI